MPLSVCVYGKYEELVLDCGEDVHGQERHSVTELWKNAVQKLNSQSHGKGTLFVASQALPDSLKEKRIRSERQQNSSKV